jgi:hypothetical protein
MDQLRLPRVAVTAEEQEIAALASALEPQAQLILLKIARRLRAGQEQYGKMNVQSDPRNFFAEAAEEAMDFVVYYEMHKLRCG